MYAIWPDWGLLDPLVTREGGRPPADAAPPGSPLGPGGAAITIGRWMGPSRRVVSAAATERGQGRGVPSVRCGPRAERNAVPGRAGCRDGSGAPRRDAPVYA